MYEYPWKVGENGHFLLYSPRVRTTARIRYLRGKRAEEDGQYTYLGAAKVGFLSLKRVTELYEDRISARSSGPRLLVSHQPLLMDSSGYKKGASISESELSALGRYPNLLSEAVRTRGDDMKGINNAYEGLVKDGKL